MAAEVKLERVMLNLGQRFAVSNGGHLARLGETRRDI